MKNNGLYWEGWSSNIMEAYSEIIIHSICVFIISYLILLYFWIFVFYREPCILKQPNNTPQISSNMMEHSIKSKSSQHIPDRSTKLQTSKSYTFSDKELYYINSKLIIKKNGPNHLRFKNYLLLSLIISGLQIYMNYYSSVLGVLIFNIRPDNGCFMRACISTSGIYLQRYVLYVFFFQRLRITFKNSVHKIKPIIFKIIIAAFVLTSSGVAVSTIYATYLIGSFRCVSDDGVSEDGAGLLRINIIIGGLTDIFWATFITVMFVRKLKVLMKKRKHWKFVLIMKKLTLLS